MPFFEHRLTGNISEAHQFHSGSEVSTYHLLRWVNEIIHATWNNRADRGENVTLEYAACVGDKFHLPSSESVLELEDGTWLVKLVDGSFRPVPGITFASYHKSIPDPCIYPFGLFELVTDNEGREYVVPVSAKGEFDLWVRHSNECGNPDAKFVPWQIESYLPEEGGQLSKFKEKSVSSPIEARQFTDLSQVPEILDWINVVRHTEWVCSGKWGQLLQYAAYLDDFIIVPDGEEAHIAKIGHWIAHFGGKFSVYSAEAFSARFEPDNSGDGPFILTQDAPGHWYVIPAHLEADFESWSESEQAKGDSYAGPSYEHFAIGGSPSRIVFPSYVEA